MPAVEVSPISLAQIIQTETEQLLEDWEEAALEIAPQLKGEDSRALGHHARPMLEFIAEDLLSFQTCEESARKALGKGKAPASDTGGEHGTHRFQQGLSMLQMVQELRALRLGLREPGALKSGVAPQKTSMNWFDSTRPSTN